MSAPLQPGNRRRWINTVSALLPLTLLGTKGTAATSDDDVSSFTNTAAGGRQIDLLAPGESIVSLRDPGSFIDNTYPAARVGDTLFRGSGTSQAAAVTTAAVAPAAAGPADADAGSGQGRPEAGHPADQWQGGILKLRELNLAGALTATPVKTAAQYWKQSSGTGTVDGARGKSRVVNGKVALAGDGWTGTSFASKTCAAGSWTGTPWGGDASWVDPAWQGRFWAGRFWAASDWQGRFWASEDWSTAAWE